MAPLPAFGVSPWTCQAHPANYDYIALGRGQKKSQKLTCWRAATWCFLRTVGKTLPCGGSFVKLKLRLFVKSLQRNSFKKYYQFLGNYSRKNIEEL
jgi:hypothetical protein